MAEVARALVDIERLKDIAYDLGAIGLKVTIPTGPDTWATVAIREASIWTDGGDGWDVSVEEDGL